MLTSAQVTKLREVVGASWITVLRAPTIKQLVEAGSIQLSLFNTQNLAEVTGPRYPGERLDTAEVVLASWTQLPCWKPLEWGRDAHLSMKPELALQGDRRLLERACRSLL